VRELHGMQRKTFALTMLRRTRPRAMGSSTLIGAHLTRAAFRAMKNCHGMSGQAADIDASDRLC
jgi:hypothetical protein